MPLDPTARPAVQLVPIVRLLAAHQVDWVLTGSTVLALHGGRIVPNDVDVTPALDHTNLERLADALATVEATPAYLPDWPSGPSLQQCAAWAPHPATEENLDHLFVTRLGMIDIPPRLCGTYDQLIGQTGQVDIGGVVVRVCALTEVLRRLRGHRPKDRQRAAVYAELAQRAPAAPTPQAVTWLLAQLDARAPR